MRNFIKLLCFSLVFIACTTKRVSNNTSGNYERQIITFFKGEILPEKSKPCFQGAYYRKLVSSTDNWNGIEGVVVLPEIKFDQDRKHPKKPMQFLDNPSVYLGGNMNEQETDIGLTWEVIKDKNGVVSKDRRAFRPFLRRNEYKDEQKAVFEYAPAEEGYYFYPGDEVKISLKLVADKTLRFSVESKGKKFERDFICNGFIIGAKGKFKRVNAIDQVANEGKPVQPTNTQVLNADWKETSLFRNVDGETVKVPFHSGRYTEMECPAPTFFKVQHSKKQKAIGAETISISGAGKF